MGRDSNYLYNKEEFCVAENKRKWPKLVITVKLGTLIIHDIYHHHKRTIPGQESHMGPTFRFNLISVWQQCIYQYSKTKFQHKGLSRGSYKMGQFLQYKALLF